MYQSITRTVNIEKDEVMLRSGGESVATKIIRLFDLEKYELSRWTKHLNDMDTPLSAYVHTEKKIDFDMLCTASGDAAGFSSLHFARIRSGFSGPSLKIAESS